MQLGETGRYTLLRPLGQGGMAEVFLAKTKGLEDFERHYVVKRILPRLTEDRKFVRMFLDEARITVALQHTNIVQVHDLGEAGGQYFIVMEYVDGMDLRRLMIACEEAGTSFPYKHILFVVMEALKGLAYAHQARDRDGQPLGIVHRDISPSNIMISRGGAVKLMDFGIARAAIAKWDNDPGEILGKFRYFAPELVAGIDVSVQSDIFAIGAVLYELVTGDPLLLGGDFHEVRDELRAFSPEEAIDRDLSIPTPLEPILLRALATDPADRYESAEELLGDLTDHVFEDRIRISATDFAGFIADLEEILANLEEREVGDMVEPPSLSLDLVDEPPDDDLSTSRSLSLGDGRSRTEVLEWRFPRGTDAVAFVPGAGLKQCDGRTLRTWIVQGHIGFHTLIRFHGDRWRPVIDFYHGTPPPDPERRWTRSHFSAINFRSVVLASLGDQPAGVVTCWTGDEIVCFHLHGPTLVATEGSATSQGLVEALEADGLLTPTQAMVISHVAGEDDDKVREALLNRNLLNEAQLEAHASRRALEHLKRMFLWERGALLVGSPEQVKPDHPPLMLDQLIAQVVRSEVTEPVLVSTFTDYLDHRLQLAFVGAPQLPVTLSQRESVLLDPSVESWSVREVLQSGVFPSPDAAFRALLLLVQFDLVNLGPP